MTTSGDGPGELREALRQANERLRALPQDRDEQQTLAMLAAVFVQCPMPVTLSRADDGHYVEVNDEWSRLMGFTREEALGRSAVDLNIWSSGTARTELLVPLRQQGRLRNVEMGFRAKDGRRVQVLLSGTMVSLSGVAYYLMFLGDLTAGYDAQAALKTSEASLQKVNEQLNHQLALYDLTEQLAKVGHWIGTKEGGFSSWSPNMYALVGLQPGSVSTSAQARSTIVAEDKALFAQARERMDGQEIEYRFHHSDGSLRWVRSRLARQYNQDGEPLFDFGVVQEITAEHHARQALQQQLDFLSKITGKVPGMLFQYQRNAAGHAWFAFASEGIGELFRVTPEQARQDAAHVFAVVHPQDLPGLLQSLQEAAAGSHHWAQEFRAVVAQGPERFLFVNALAYPEPDGGVVSYGAITDITERKQSEARLQDSEARFRSLTELSSDWYWEQDEHYRFVRFEGTNGELDAPRDTEVGMTRWDIPAPNMTEQDWSLHKAVLDARQPFRDLELQRKGHDGEPTWFLISGVPIFDARGQFRGYRGIGRDITERKRAEAKIQHLAFFDVLTGLPNRRMLLDRLQTALAASGRYHQRGALLFIDLDNFKDLNDTQGHDVGDQLLKQVAQRLITCVREIDTVARLGGDEFVVMLEELDTTVEGAAAQAEAVGKKIISSLNQPYHFARGEHHSTPSLGITLFYAQQESVDELLKRADLAMYQAKSAGRNTLRFFDPKMQAAVSARAELETDLRQGLQRNELLLYYQPVVNAQLRITGFEALVRWLHPQRGMVMPGEFIPLAEQTGLILPMGHWVLETALRQLVHWNGDARTRGLTVAVNVSARQFRHPDFASQVLELLKRTGANPYRLKLELTESLLLLDVQDAINKMTELRSIGVSFALDDFGTGYSSLSYLKRLPLDQLKIDQSFVRDILSDPNDAAIARTVLALAQSLDLAVVAEGVESEGQREFLVRNGCKAFQGYLFGRPAPIDDFLTRLFAD